MLVNEIFTSIEGEGKRTGLPATFIRLYGCNLRCKYCDTMYAVKGGKKEFKKMSVKEILEKVKSLGIKAVTITGGEPLIQKDFKKLAKSLCEAGYWVNVETNGSIPIEYQDKSIFYTMDWKSVYSGEAKKMLRSNLPLLRSYDVLKFVVANKTDFKQAVKIVSTLSLAAHPQVYISPVFGKIEARQLVQMIKESDTLLSYNTKFQLQIHKVVWEPDKRGV